MPSLIDAAALAPSNTVVEVHVGAVDEGDVLEAKMLQAAIADASSARAGGVSCRVVVHEGRDHNLVVDMRDAGELHDLLRRVAAAPASTGGGDPTAQPGIPADFDGFKDCPDF